MGGWLCPTDQDRVRALDMSGRVRRARSVAAGAVGLGLVALAPWLGWWTLALFGVALLNLLTLDWRISRSRRPERVIAGSLCIISIVLVAAVALTGGSQSVILFWLILPAAMVAARFRSRVVVVGGVLTAAEMLVVSVAVGGADLAADPRTLIAAIVLLIGIVALTTALVGAELQYRGESALDPLTGLLNRAGLKSRFAEVAEQARLVDKPVCLLACDLDNFKTVNDTHGHDRGDHVLRDAAYEMRKELRSFELFYRLGGEEFLGLLPGMDQAGGAEIAERLRYAVERAQPGGVKVTLSIGVAAASGPDLDYESLFRAADEALYRAKRTGRNCVTVAGAPNPPPVGATTARRTAPVAELA
jgi:diguanylate cyclase (GGDEF)-like protein